jgi:hypothetical protein
MLSPKLISPSQTTFIRGRFITDGAVILHEIVHELRSKRQLGVIFKIDFEKAYDIVRWDFVEEVLDRKGFDRKLKEWIMSTIRGGECASTSMGRMGRILKLIGG